MRRWRLSAAIMIVTLAVSTLGVLGPNTSRDALAAAGVLDPTFGCQNPPCPGFSTDPNENGFFEALVLQSDGKIVTAGSTSVQFLLARWESTGVLDVTFGCDSPPCQGAVNFGTGGFSAVVLQTDGKIVAAGSLIPPNPPGKFALYRFNPNGTLDESFGCGTPPCSGFTTGPDGDGRDLVIQADGKMVIAGFDEQAETFLIARYDTNGVLDTSFGCTMPPCSGIVSGPAGLAYSIALQPDQKLVVAGVAVGPDDGMFRVARYDDNGMLDTSFGCTAPPCNGFVTGPSGPSSDQGDRLFTAIALQEDGKIVLASNDGSNPLAPNFLVARYGANGVLDAIFGCTTPPCSGFAVGPQGLVNGNGIVLQSDGKIVVGGASSDAAGAFRVLRMDERGILDPWFGCSEPPCSGFISRPEAGLGISTALQADQKIVTVGLLEGEFGQTKPTVARYENSVAQEICYKVKRSDATSGNEAVAVDDPIVGPRDAVLKLKKAFTVCVPGSIRFMTSSGTATNQGQANNNSFVKGRICYRLKKDESDAERKGELEVGDEANGQQTVRIRTRKALLACDQALIDLNALP